MINQKPEIENKPNIYLIGFMGVGKTAVGKRVARKLRMEFIDSDKAIERKVGKSVNEIFAQEGERFFRGLEREFIQNEHNEKGCIVACGGGLPVEEGMLEILKSKGIVVGLFADSDAILERANRRNTRPMLNVEDKEAKIADLLEKRQDIYKDADYLFFSQGRPIEAVAGDIVRVYLRRFKV